MITVVVVVVNNIKIVNNNKKITTIIKITITRTITNVALYAQEQLKHF